jgi:2-polyprenyl-6-methoxyphenol hydroxylase-like FAD-dependent oxidoreductase
MTRIVVVGAGIAGPVTAMALQKAGFEPTIHEAFDRTAEGVGSFMNIGPNGLDALECLDLVEVACQRGFDTPVMAFYKHGGRRITPDIRTDRLSYGGYPIRSLLRSDLYVALRDEAARRGIPVEYGKCLIGATRTRSGVRAEFDDGSSAEGAALVGADGLHSRVRRIIDPAAPAPRYLRVLNAFGFHGHYDSDEAPGAMRMYFNRRCFFMTTQAPDGRLWWFANPPRPVAPTEQELRAPDRREQLLRLLRDDEGPAYRIVRDTPEIPPLFANRDLPTVRHWHRDRMVIIGDAAHGVSPTVGSGASIAMEDAVVLAKCLRDNRDVDEAFRVYEGVRRARVEAVVAQGKYNIGFNWGGPLTRMARDRYLKWVFTRPPHQVKDPTWMQSHHIEWEAPERVAS